MNELKKKRLEDSKIARKRFIYSLIVPGFFLFLAFSVKLIETLEGISFAQFGIKPLSWEGLYGVLFAPLIHGDWEHLGANAVPLLILGSALFYFYRGIGFKVFIFIYLFTGAWVWFGARDAWHIGASGVIYGLGAFLFMSGVLRNYIPLMALSLIVVFLYGSLVWGVIPMAFDVPYSWESHLYGSISGFVLALVYRKEGPQRPIHEWEEEEYNDPYWEDSVYNNSETGELGKD